MDKEPFYAKFIEKPQRSKKKLTKKECKALLENEERKEKLAHRIEKKNENTEKIVQKSAKIKIEKKALFYKLTKEEYDIINLFLQFVDPVLNLNKKQKHETYKKILENYFII